MPRVDIRIELNQDRYPSAAGHVQKLINTAVTTWHAAFPGGGAVAETNPATFTNPSSVEADRVPELALAAGGTPGTYVITGTWSFDDAGNPLAQTDSITTVANDTVKGSVPFDTITSIVGPDPVQPLTLNKGDSYFEPPARAIWTGSSTGALAVQLMGEDAVQLVPNLPASRDWPRRAKRVGATNAGTTLTAPWAVW